MRHTRSGDRADRLELHVAAIEIVEEARAAAEEKRNDMNLQFLNEAGREVLLRDIRSAAQRHIFAIRCVPGLLQCRLDAVGDEKECRATLHGQRFAREMGEHENWMVVWRVVAPPTLPRVIFYPRAVASAEHIATHDRRADILKRLPQYIVVYSCFPATHVTVNRSKRFQFEKPVVEMIPSFTERILDALVRPSDVSV